MATMKAFRSVRPAEALAPAIAALPYDVYNRKEAKGVVSKNPLSFLKIDRAETQFPDQTDMYSQAVYDRAAEMLTEMIEEGSFVQEDTACYYIYELTMNGHVQTGLVGCAAIDDYIDGVIMKHENTREDKELDRIRHVDTLSAQTGPIFLAYRANEVIHQILVKVKKEKALYDFTAEDGVVHRVWRINDSGDILGIANAFAGISKMYIADGHHRAASAVKVGLMRREENPGYIGDEEFNYFLSVLFPDDELRIFDYNRVVKDLNGSDSSAFLEEIAKNFEVELIGKDSYAPAQKGEMGLYVEGNWYKLTMNSRLQSEDPVKGLDVSILQDVILGPLLGINDPKTDERISFVGGIRGLKELSDTVDAQGDGVAFSMYPTSMTELLAVADAGMLMPPKSTWFEPKLRSGLFIHKF
ncbi:MAG: DUF1015 family protein [Hespellia sp.]|nr:DUF1015 family protein [Hespellia sp.]